jgi:hypothetical protein
VQADHYDAGADRWFGVLGRYVNDGTYYYLSVRSSNTLSLRKVVNGSITVLGTVPFTPATSAPWRPPAPGDHRQQAAGVRQWRAGHRVHR